MYGRQIKFQDQGANDSGDRKIWWRGKRMITNLMFNDFESNQAEIFPKSEKIPFSFRLDLPKYHRVYFKTLRLQNKENEWITSIFHEIINFGIVGENCEYELVGSPEEKRNNSNKI